MSTLLKAGFRRLIRDPNKIATGLARAADHIMAGVVVELKGLTDSNDTTFLEFLAIRQAEKSSAKFLSSCMRICALSNILLEPFAPVIAP
jgi:hypothetical protein